MKHYRFSKNYLISDQTASFWVSASAGSGKTQLLTKRVLSLLVQGIEPTRILCITFTKAAAAEMLERISNQLSLWVSMPDSELLANVTEILEREPKKDELFLARTIFARLIDDNFSTLKIQTIHAFCQSLLAKFPLEASIEPYFNLIDAEGQKELKEETKIRIFTDVKNFEKPELKVAVSIIAANIHDEGINDIIEELFSNRSKIKNILQDGSFEEFENNLANYLGLEMRDDENKIIADFIAEQPTEKELRNLLPALSSTGKVTDSVLANSLSKWLSAPLERRDLIKNYQEAFLKNDGTLKINICTNAVEKEHAGAIDILRKEQQRVAEFVDKLKCLKTLSLSKNLLVFAAEFFKIYEKLKKHYSYLDYDDLIEKTIKLLNTPGISEWIMFKLDEGIDHIMLDEAQDTSPEQWQIVSSICSEFFAGEGIKSSKKRTLFIVGDEKQSIFSFQGADRKIFATMREYFRNLAKSSEKKWENLQLNRSFRSSTEVLKLVDEVFKKVAIQQNITSEYSDHIATRQNQGRVELWPVVTKEKKEYQKLGWRIPVMQEKFSDAGSELANQIAEKIKEWIEAGRLIEKTGKPIKPGDVMVLVRKRSNFIFHLQRALKERGINVSGADRILLTDHIAVLDLIALGNFLLLPEDDYNLACLLKSPLFSFTEEEIYELAAKRSGKTLFTMLKEKSFTNEKFKLAHEYLLFLLNQADFESPFEFFTKVLERDGARKKFIRRLGRQAEDAINEFLRLALNFQKNHIPTMQGFLFWLKKSEVEIRRDMENKGDEVKIMTVHGAKGLEAPIVFLVDIISPDHGGKKIIFPEDKNIFIWPAIAANYPTKFIELKENEKSKEYEEYVRLLYVALTRAQDEIYICAFQPGERNLNSESKWHNIVKTSLANYADKIEEAYISGANYKVDDAKFDVKIEARKIPAFYHQKIVEVKLKKEVIRPSLIEDKEDGKEFRKFALSPANKAFERGNIIHKILEFAVHIKILEREGKIKNYIEKYARAFSAQEKDKMFREVMNLLTDEKFAAVFSTSSRAEVSVAGMVEGRQISGQIDRLYIDDNVIIISDYKTNMSPPEKLEEIPKKYIAQLALYKKLLRSNYPDKKINCCLIWTAKPEIMEVPEEIIDNHKIFIVV